MVALSFAVEATTGFGATVIALALGVHLFTLGELLPVFVPLGLFAGFYRGLDGVIMRMMDGIMAIPSILLAIALVALTRPSVGIVIVAIAIPEIPRVVRLVRSVVLSVRGECRGGGEQDERSDRAHEPGIIVPCSSFAIDRSRG